MIHEMNFLTNLDAIIITVVIAAAVTTAAVEGTATFQRMFLHIYTRRLSTVF